MTHSPTRVQRADKSLSQYILLKAILDSREPYPICYLLLIKSLIDLRAFATRESISRIMGDDPKEESKHLKYLVKLGWVVESRGFYTITKEGHHKLDSFNGLQTMAITKFYK